MDNKTEWLKQPPPVIRNLNEGTSLNPINYIPIGEIEQLLDELDSDWSTSDFKFQIIRINNFWFADASCILYVGQKYIQGAVTFQISSRDTNMDFAATALSFCISNAAKRIGIKFGRALNGRLDRGETSIPITQSNEPLVPDEVIDKEFNEVKKKLSKIKFMEDAQEYLKTTTFHLSVECKNLVNSKPLKINCKK